MKPHIIAVMSTLIIAGCNVPAWGNLFVLAVTLALFCATLSLGRHIAPPNDPGSPSDSETVQH
jgi:hypothetical protein